MSSIRSSAKAITVINLKGGVGKTHISWMLAGLCAEEGRRCLAVDLDQQGNLTRNLVDGEWQKGAEAIFAPGSEADAKDLVLGTSLKSVDLIPAGPSLQPFDLSDQRQWEESDLQFALCDIVSAVKPQYDYIVFDCPTKLSLAGFAALTASDFAIVPLEPADWGAQGVSQVTQAIDYVKRKHNPRLRLLGYVISRLKARRKYHRIYADELRSRFEDLVFDTEIPDLAGYEQAVTHAVPINLRRPTSKEAGIGHAFFAEVERRIDEHAAGSAASSGAGVQPRKHVAV